MTYSESAEGVVITRKRALQELKDHGVGTPESIAAFYDECGDCDTYDASDVLAWLGY